MNFRCNKKINVWREFESFVYLFTDVRCTFTVMGRCLGGRTFGDPTISYVIIIFPKSDRFGEVIDLKDFKSSISKINLFKKIKKIQWFIYLLTRILQYLQYSTILSSLQFLNEENSKIKAIGCNIIINDGLQLQWYLFTFVDPLGIWFHYLVSI